MSFISSVNKIARAIDQANKAQQREISRQNREHERSRKLAEKECLRMEREAERFRKEEEKNRISKAKEEQRKLKLKFESDLKAEKKIFDERVKDKQEIRMKFLNKRH